MVFDRIDSALLASAVAPWSPEARFFEEIDSTNRAAMEWAREAGPDMGIVVAGHQSAGRGRLDRQWFAPRGQSLLFSLILKPLFDSEQLPLINLAAALGLCRALESLDFKPQVKWPNDVLLSGRKVAGILSEIEVAESGDENPEVVVGIGVNVNVESFPADIETTATSLLVETGKAGSRLKVLSAFLESFVPIYESFPLGVVEGYRPYSCTIGSKVRVALSEREIEDRAVDLDSQGRLVLSEGTIIDAGDVIHLR